MKIIPLAAAFALTACSTMPPDNTGNDFGRAAFQAFSAHKKMVIFNNYGGSLGIGLAVTRALMRKGLVVEIEASCSSACTLLLAETKGLCYYPDTLFGFHSPSAPTRQATNATRKAMLHSYPPKLAKWLANRDALRTAEVTFISGEELAKLDFPREFCSTQD